MNLLTSPVRPLVGLVAGAVVAGALVFTTSAATAEPAPAGGADVLILDDPAYVDTVPVSKVGPKVEGHEVPNLILALQADGNVVTSVSGTNASTLAAALAGKDVFVVPDQENRFWAPDLNAAARKAVADWVRAGGTLVVTSDYASTLGRLFGYRIGPAWNTTKLGATSTRGPLGSGPASLAVNDGSVVFALDSLPKAAVAQYVTPDGRSAGVFTVAEGSGTVVSLGWDWYNAAPGVAGGRDGGWNAVLGAAVRITPGATAPAATPSAPAKAKVPSNAFTLPSRGKADLRRGTLTLSLKLPASGHVRLAPARKGQVKSVTRSVSAKGKVTVAPSRATLTKLRKQLKGKKRSASVKVRVKVTYTPTGGTSRTVTRTYALKLKK